MRSWLDKTCNLAGMIAEAKIELRKKYYDGNMVRDAVMSVTDDYNTIMKLLSAFADQPPLTDVIEVVRCKDCKWWDKREGSNYGYCHAAKHGYYSSNWEISIYRTYKEDFFCGDGERKEVDDERGEEDEERLDATEQG